MSARTIYETAPLGALVRFSNGEPQPPARFIHKLRAWRRDNGEARLIAKTPSATVGRHVIPDCFTLFEGGYGPPGLVLLVVHREHSANSSLTFEVIEIPPAGCVLCLIAFRELLELKHLAPDRAAAAAWHASQRHVGDPHYREVQPDGTHLNLALEAFAP